MCVRFVFVCLCVRGVVGSIEMIKIMWLVKFT